MLSLEFVRENLDLVRENCRHRGVDLNFDDFSATEDKRRKIIKKVDDLKHRRNEISREKNPAPEIVAQGQELKRQIKKEEAGLKVQEEKLAEFMVQVPNILLPSVPIGESETDNVILRKEGEVPKFDFQPKSYLDLGEALDLIDISRATKVAGSRFSYLKNELVLIQFALLDLAFGIAQEAGFQPVLPPVMIKPELMERMGYTALAESNIYLIEKDNLNLVGTSEQSLGVMHQDEILEDLPRRYIGYSTCFRREAGTYGRDLKGILRVHQFDKAELFSFCRPEESAKEHELFVEIEEKIMRKLELPYQVVALSSADLAKPSAATIDIETWLPSEQKYRETHSSSNCTDYQARGLNVRYRSERGKMDYVHTLNGTAVAMGRILAAILENYQLSDGSVAVPKALQNYLGLKKISR